LPWFDEPDLAWHKSAVRVRTARIAEEAYAEEPLQYSLERVREQLPAKGKWGVLLPLVLQEDAMWRGVARNEKGESVTVYYTRELGLMMVDELSSPRGENTHESA